MTKSFSITLFFVLFGAGLAAQATTYSLTLEIPDQVTESQVLALFKDHPEIRDVRLSGGSLSLIVPSKEHYPVTVIREILAERKITAIDYSETDSEQKVSAKVKTLETSSIKVYGNCGMCKDRIERAARSVKGVVVAVWDEEKAMLTFKYQPAIINLDAVHEALAKVGHDTDKFRAKDADYQELHSCCKYERPKSVIGN